MRKNDALFAVGHKVTSNTRVTELSEVHPANAELDFSNFGFTSHIVSTTDEYHHSSRSILDFSCYVTPMWTLQAVEHHE